jgi:hypothetical protein
MLFVLPGKGCTCLDTPGELPFGGHISYPGVFDEKRQYGVSPAAPLEPQLLATCT